MLCPQGHKVSRLPTTGRIVCATCERSYSDRHLVPVTEKIRRAEHRPYAKGYRRGYEDGCADTVELMAKEEV